mmetsp:Transcript_26277/g.77094  ORF Transcript_26277/g.77094 Transcript_26277/m.77094 type:complete len:277 (-) Transcript_26277:841-1671(-)
MGDAAPAAHRNQRVKEAVLHLLPADDREEDGQGQEHGEGPEGEHKVPAVARVHLEEVVKGVDPDRHLHHNHELGGHAAEVPVACRLVPVLEEVGRNDVDSAEDDGPARAHHPVKRRVVHAVERLLHVTQDVLDVVGEGGRLSAYVVLALSACHGAQTHANWAPGPRRVLRPFADANALAAAYGARAGGAVPARGPGSVGRALCLCLGPHHRVARVPRAEAREPWPARPVSLGCETCLVLGSRPRSRRHVHIFPASCALASSTSPGLNRAHGGLRVD